MRRTVRAVILHVLAPLALGSIIYLFWRDQSLSIFGFALNAQPHSLTSVVSLPRFVLYSLPDGFWVYSFTAFMTLVWRGSRSRFRFLWLLSGLALAIACELGQLAGVVPGTYDVLDLLSAIVATLLALFLNTK